MSIANSYPRETREFVGVPVWVDDEPYIPTKLQVVRRFDRPLDAAWTDPEQIGDGEDAEYGFHLDDPWLPTDDTARLGTWAAWAQALVPGEGEVVLLAGRFTMT